MMKLNAAYKFTSISLMALSTVILPVSVQSAYAQDSEPLTETSPVETPASTEQPYITPDGSVGETPGTLNEPDQNAVQDIESSQENMERVSQQTIESAEAAAQRAELAAQRAAENVEESSDWGWLGLLGLIGLFGLAGRSKRRTDVNDNYQESVARTGAPRTTPSDYR